MSNNTESYIELKDFFLKIKEYKQHLLINKVSIFKGLLIFSIIGLLIAVFFNKPYYSAEISFVVEGESTTPMSTYNSIESQFGVNVFGEYATFSRENVMEIIKSRSVIEEALMCKAIINKSEKLLIDHYLDINN